MILCNTGVMKTNWMKGGVIAALFGIFSACANTSPALTALIAGGSCAAGSDATGADKAQTTLAGAACAGIAYEVSLAARENKDAAVASIQGNQELAAMYQRRREKLRVANEAAEHENEKLKQKIALLSNGSRDEAWAYQVFETGRAVRAQQRQVDNDLSNANRHMRSLDRRIKFAERQNKRQDQLLLAEKQQLEQVVARLRASESEAGRLVAKLEEMR